MKRAFVRYSFLEPHEKGYEININEDLSLNWRQTAAAKALELLNLNFKNYTDLKLVEVKEIDADFVDGVEGFLRELRDVDELEFGASVIQSRMNSFDHGFLTNKEEICFFLDLIIEEERKITEETDVKDIKRVYAMKRLGQIEYIASKIKEGELCFD